MNKKHTVDMKQLERAVDKVRNELARHGFLDEAMDDVDVYLVPLGSAYGRQWYGGSGSIHVPALSWSKFKDWWSGGYTALADVLRHEYGHAFADTHRGLMRRKTFREAFGAPHGFTPEWEEYDEEIFVSPYATENPMEDFAETFMLFLRHDGRLPKRLDKPCIRAKWRWIDGLRRRS